MTRKDRDFKISSPIKFSLHRYGMTQQIHGSPKAVARKFIGIPIMVSILMMQPMAIHPGDRIYIDPEGVIHDRDELL